MFCIFFELQGLRCVMVLVVCEMGNDRLSMIVVFYIMVMYFRSMVDVVYYMFVR